MKPLRLLQIVLCTIATGCVHAPLMDRPETCSPLPDQMLCPSQSLDFPEAGGFCCYRCPDIEPFLERCGK